MTLNSNFGNREKLKNQLKSSVKSLECRALKLYERISDDQNFVKMHVHTYLYENLRQITFANMTRISN
jgi:hypothetical protein